MDSLKLKKVAALVLTMVMLVSGCSLSPQAEEELAPPIKAPEQVEYTTETVKKGNIANTIKASCTVVSEKQSSLSFTQRGGYLQKINVLLGQDVAAGDVIATLDTDSLQKEIQTKEIKLQQLQMELTNLQNNTASVELERKNLKLSHLQEQYAQAGSTDQELAYQIEDLKLEIKQMQATADANTKFQIEYKKKDLQIAQIELDDLRMTLSKSTITAPISGKVVYIEELATGEFVPALKTVVKLADPSDLVMEYKGTSAPKIKLGMAATVTIGGKPYEGEVVMTPSEVPAEQYELKKDTILIKANGLPPETKIGDFGDFEIVVEKKEDVIVVPKNAVVQSIGSYYARVLVNGIRNERSIEVGISSANEYEVISGLHEGDTLILE